jgi:hypothetical protein
MFAASEGFADICRVLIDAHRKQRQTAESSCRTEEMSNHHTGGDDAGCIHMDIDEGDSDESPSAENTMRWELDVDAQNEVC